MSSFDTTSDDSEPSGIRRTIERARAGSSESLGKLAEQCRRYLLLVANRELDAELRAKVGASDLVQDTIVQAQHDFPRFVGGSEGELRAWLRKILLNRVGSIARHYRGTDKRDIGREQRLAEQNSAAGFFPLAASDPTPSKQAVINEEHLLLGRALAKLPEDYRTVIRLRSFERLPFAEVGSGLGRSEEAAHKVWLRAIKRLQTELDASRGGDVPKARD